VLLAAMALLLDAYMQWFHIGSYRLAGFFSQRGGLVHVTGKQALAVSESDHTSVQAPQIAMLCTADK
jgi:hypothetical protein